MRWVDHFAHVDALGGHRQPPGLQTVIGHIRPWRNTWAFTLCDNGGPMVLHPSDAAQVAHLPLPNSGGCMAQSLDTHVESRHLGPWRLFLSFLSLNQKEL